MNILLICDLFLPSIGGVELFSNRLARNLIARGHNVIVAANRHSPDLKKEETIEGLRIYRFNFSFPNSPVKYPGFLFSLIRTGNMLRQIVSRNDIDIINLQFAASNAFFAVLTKYITGVPLVVSVHGNDIQKFPVESRVYRYLLTHTLKKANRVTANSRALLNQAVQYYPHIIEKGAIIPSPVEIEDFEYKEKYIADRPYVFSMGRFEYKKGFDVLIKAFKYIPPDSGLDLLIAGSGPEYDACKKLAEELGLGDRVKLIGFQSRENILKLYNGCEFFILPARKAPCDRVMLEALSAKKAFIGSKVDGVLELIKDGESGLLVEPENPKELSEAMLRLIKDKQLKEKLETNGRARVEAVCNWNRATELYINVYSAVLK